MTQKVVAYYRVSTDRQRASGLGLEAQRHAVLQICGARDMEIVREFTETESGANRKRPVFAEARALCRKHKYLLVIAKIDRLSRDLGFVCALRDSGIEFMAADMPDANKLTVNLMAIIAEHERDAIGKRTKEALAAKKARGFKLGSPNPEKGAAAGRLVIANRAASHKARVMPIIREIQASGIKKNEEIATALNARGVPTSRGGDFRWHGSSVWRLLLDEAEPPIAAVPASPPVTPQPIAVRIPFREKDRNGSPAHGRMGRRIP